jgi:hypothetical protein
MEVSASHHRQVTIDFVGNEAFTQTLAANLLRGLKK